MIRAFFRDSLVYTIPAVISRGLSIFLVPLYTRVLSPTDYGVLDMLTVFAGLINLTIALEISQAVARFYADEKTPDGRVLYASTALWFTAGAYGLFFAVSQVFAGPIATAVIRSTGHTAVFRLSVLHITLNGLFYLLQNQFRWELKSKRYATVSTLTALTTAAVSVIAAYVFRLGLVGILLGLISGVLVGASYGFWHLRTTFALRFDRNRLGEMLRFSAPLVPSGIAVFVSHYIDRLMINHFLSLNELGLYGLGFRLSSVVGLVMTGFQSALMPLVYQNHHHPGTPAQIAAIFRYFVAIALGVYLGLALFAQEVFWLLTTPSFYPAAGIVVFLVPAILLSNMYIFAPGIAIAKRTELMIWINAGGAVAHALFNWLLIPPLGYRGAALATLIGYLCIFAAYMVLSQRLYRVPHRWSKTILGAVLASIIVAVGDRLPWSTLTNIVAKSALIGLFALSIVGVGLVRIDELRALTRRQRPTPN